jgi:beta-mannanase
VVAAIAVALPFLGSWAAADDESEPKERTAAARAEPDPAGRQARAERGRGPARPRATGQVAVGAYVPDGTRRPSRFTRYARMTGHTPAILLYYRNWKAKHAFDAVTLRRIARQRAVPMLTWEPARTSLRDIAAGRHDRYVRRQARDARRFRRPVLVRFAHEMNGDWYSWGAHANTPATFIAAWRRVVGLFRDEGARNARFVWSPNADDEGLGRIVRRYPGDRWVDWVGLSGFSWGGPWDWEGPSDIFYASYRALTRITKRPLMIAETAAHETGGDKADWIRWLFDRDLRQMPRVRAVVWFNGRENWARWDVDSTRRSLRAFRKHVASPRYSGTATDVERGGRRK